MSKKRLGLQALHTTLYWLGVILAVACGSIIVVEHVTVLRRFEPEQIPSSLVVGGLAILAFVAGELVNSIGDRRGQTGTPEKTSAKALSTATEANLGSTVPIYSADPPPSRDALALAKEDLLPDQIATLSKAMDVLDEVRGRVGSRDAEAALPLINDTREKLAALVGGNIRATGPAKAELIGKSVPEGAQ
jgi:hypothetical protein